MTTTQSSLEKRVEELEARVSELEDVMGGGTVMRTESDIETFLETVSPGTHVEQATTLGYYLVHEKEENPFTVGHVEDAYKECRLPKPANMSDVLAGAEDRGWMTRSGTKGRKHLWTITPDGDSEVERGFE